MKTTLILLGLSAFATAAPGGLKRALAQTTAKLTHGDDETPGEGILDCSCELPGTAG